MVQSPLAKAMGWRLSQHSKRNRHLEAYSIETSWSHRLAWPRTVPSQGTDTGSNPVGTTNLPLKRLSACLPGIRSCLGADHALLGF